METLDLIVGLWEMHVAEARANGVAERESTKPRLGEAFRDTRDPVKTLQQIF